MSEKNDSSIIPPLLEVPSNVEVGFSTSGISPIFSEDSFKLAAAKVVGLEGFLAAATQDTSFRDFMRDVLVIFLSLVKSEAGSILEVDEENKNLFFRAASGRSSDRVTNIAVPLGQGIVGNVVESKLPLIVANVPENKDHLKSIEKAVGFETHNMIAVPILVRGRVYGVLELLNRIGDPNYTQADQQLLSYLSTQAAKVIELRLMISWVRSHHSSDDQFKKEAA